MAQLREDPCEDPAHRRLGDADLAGDLVLGQSIVEAQAQDEAVSLIEGAQRRSEHHARFERTVLVVVVVGQQVAQVCYSSLAYGAVQ